MKVLVTGGCGFLGSHVCEFFRKAGWEVVSLDNLTRYEFAKSGYSEPDARFYNFKFLESLGIKTVVEDVRIWNSISKLDVDYIVHTAAQPTMTLSIENPRNDLENNVHGTFNMLELARKLDVPIAICSTIHVYGNKINSKLTEKETKFTCNPESIGEDYPTLNGDISPLHASKRSIEIYGQSYIDTYNLKVGIMRLSGMYGPRQFAGMHHGWVSNFIIRTLKKLPITIYGSSKQVRDILYGSDAAELFSKFWGSGKSGLFTVGGGEKNSVSLFEVLEMVHRITGLKQNMVIEGARFGDLHYFVADIGKAERELGWTPKVEPEKGLAMTVEWVRNNVGLFEGIT